MARDADRFVVDLAGAAERARERAAGVPALIAALVGLLALLPRALGLADFLTTDEAYHWLTRVERFSAALSRGDLAATAQTGHPGVTLMWLGSLGLALERLADGWGWAGDGTVVAHLAWLRLPHALLETALVAAGYVLLRRLVRPGTALLAALLWATSPYLIAHARLLHLDALLTSFVTFSLLLLLVWAKGGGRTTNDTSPDDRESYITNRAPSFSALRPLPLAASAFFAGLALLTKGPALILLPFAGLVVLVGAAERERRGGWRGPVALIRHQASFVISCYLLWLGIVLLVVVAFWPALWVAPAAPLADYVAEIATNGGRPNGDGQFFLGRAIADPGPWFYPLADLFRLTPAGLLGLLLLPVAFIGQTADEGRRANADPPPGSDGSPSAARPSPAERWTLLILGAFVLFWTLVMTLGPKKFDRYVLPTWPALLVLAGAGWNALLRVGLGRLQGVRAPGAGALAALAGGLLLAELLPLARLHPYYLSYYNPLLGGGPAAQRALLIGWGEGMDQVGAYLRTRPDIGGGPVLSALPPTLQPFVPAPVRDVAALDDAPANYAVAYLESLQRGAHPAIYERIRQTVPLHRVVINGITYAEIYQVPKPFARPVGARFGEGLVLRGVTTARAGGRLIVTPAWDVRAALPADYTLFVHLLDPSGRRVAQADVAPGGGDDPRTSAWEPGRQIAVPIDLPLPAGLPPGEYRVVLGLYDATGARLAPQGGTPADPALAGPHALLVDTVRL